MMLRMTGLIRAKNGELVARKSIPKDVREPYFKLHEVRWEERLTLPAGLPPHEAKRRHGEWL
jgi:hypothetical protein